MIVWRGVIYNRSRSPNVKFDLSEWNAINLWFCCLCLTNISNMLLQGVSRIFSTTYCACVQSLVVFNIVAAVFGITSSTWEGKADCRWKIITKVLSTCNKMFLGYKLAGRAAFDCASYTSDIASRHHFSTFLKKVSFTKSPCTDLWTYFRLQWSIKPLWGTEVHFV